MTTKVSFWEVGRLVNGWHAALPPQVREAMVSRARRREFAGGERIYSRGEQAAGLVGVVEGSVLVGGVSADGRRTLLDFYGPGAWIGEIAVFDGLPRLLDGEAHGPTVVLQLGTADVEALLAQEPAFARAVIRLQALRLRLVLTALESYAVQSLEQRLANRLLILAVQHGNTVAEGLRIELHLPQEILAQLIGSTRQRVGQILGDWQAAGLVDTHYGRIVLRDRRGLEILASGD